MATCTIAPVRDWWLGATAEMKAALIDLIENGEPDEASAESTPDMSAALDLFANLSGDELAKLDTLKLPSGRAAYSRESLIEIAGHLATSEDDLHITRRILFNVSADWKPPADPVYAATGNPAVDRTVKAVARWLSAIEHEFGIPDVVNIEHVREAFVSASKATEIMRENNRRRDARDRVKAQMMEEGLGAADGISDYSVRKFLAVSRQQCQCLYCGAQINYVTAELDHIVPRKGLGSRSTEDNLVAVCGICNREKSNLPFGVWVKQTTRPGISLAECRKRLKDWKNLKGFGSESDLRALRKRVEDRLKRTESDDAVDERSMESTAWMARELARRIEDRYSTGKSGDESGITKVYVYRGSVTAEARRAAGIDLRPMMLGGKGKQRLDRRHHAVDAAIIALIDQMPAQVLGERLALRDEQRNDTHPTTEAREWKQWAGSTLALQFAYRRWIENLQVAVPIIQSALDNDEICVLNRLRLGRNVGSIHQDTIRELDKSAPLVRDAIKPAQVDRAATPQLWTALMKQPDYRAGIGLPENPNRTLRVKNEWLAPNDRLPLLAGNAAGLALRGGYVDAGVIHHSRIYRIVKRTKASVSYVYGQVRVFAIDLPRKPGVDLFTTTLPASSISMRTADAKIRKAIESNDAEYLGWVVPGDELRLTIPMAEKGAIQEVRTLFPSLKRWEVTGFDGPDKINVRPLLLAKQEIDPSLLSDTAIKVINGKGWVIAVNKLFAIPDIAVIRRDTLGRERWKSAAHLPVCWSPYKPLEL